VSSFKPIRGTKEKSLCGTSTCRARTLVTLTYSRRKKKSAI